MPSLPSPSGPYAVGCVEHVLQDDLRPSHLLSENKGRVLSVRLWYPAAPSQGSFAPLWEDLRKLDDKPVLLKLMLAYLGRFRSASIASAAFAQEVSAPKLIVYNHGLVSFASENSSLTEDLASHGNIVLSLQHLEQKAELEALNRDRTVEQRKSDNALHQALAKASPSRRAEMGRGYYEEAKVTNKVVMERAADIEFALGRLHDWLSQIPGLDVRASSFGKVGLVGFSVGGAVATQFARSSDRAAAVANIDGGLFGSDFDRPITIPYLMLYSDISEGINDTFLPSGTRNLAMPGTKHLNFHDISLLIPILRFFGAAGKAKAHDVIEARNAEVREFFASALG